MRVKNFPAWLPREGTRVRFVADGCSEMNVAGKVKAILRFLGVFTVEIAVRRAGSATASIEAIAPSSPDEQFRGKWKCIQDGKYAFGMLCRPDGAEFTIPNEYCQPWG